ncbi:MAG: hypothetical protein H7Z72_26220 [Bacteroidetes bacterium]|nr:hypothetical protein [Fibrella sp.]
METTTAPYQPIDRAFYDILATATDVRKFVRLEYLTDLSEFIKADVSLRRLFEQDGVELLELATGDIIPLDRVVSISGQLSPHFPGYANYSCDC